MCVDEVNDMCLVAISVRELDDVVVLELEVLEELERLHVQLLGFEEEPLLGGGHARQSLQLGLQVHDGERLSRALEHHRVTVRALLHLQFEHLHWNPTSNSNKSR